MPIPLPPLAEQRRIVAKVHQILALCGKLEAAQKEREARRDLLRTTSLHNLITGESKDHVRFYLSHSPRMFTKPEHVEGLRQAILDLAVLGRLVRQDPADEPIRMALDAALARRAALVRTKAVRSKGVDGRSPLVDGVDLPNSWTTERLGNLVDPENTISYGVLVPGDHVPDGVPLVRAQDLSITTAPTRPTKSIARDIEKAYRRTRLRGGEILLCVVGSIGKLGVAPASWAGANIARAVARIDPLPEISSTYLLIALRSRMVQDYFQTTTRTLAQPTLNVGLIELTPIPVPPRAEQDRIVAKADQLLAVCDELEQSLAAEQAERTRLLEALLDTALRVAPREGAMAAV